MSKDVGWLLVVAAVGLYFTGRKDMSFGGKFSLSDLLRSTTAFKHKISNVPGPKEVENLSRLVTEVVNPLEAEHPGLIINSAYRSPELNQKLQELGYGAVANSLHLHGRAIDLKHPTLSSYQLAESVRRLNLPHTELLPYSEEAGGHLHVAI